MTTESDAEPLFTASNENIFGRSTDFTAWLVTLKHRMPRLMPDIAKNFHLETSFAQKFRDDALSLRTMHIDLGELLIFASV